MAVEYKIFLNLCQFCSNSRKNCYSGVFEVTDYESEIRIFKLKMADKLTNFMSFREVIMLYGRI